VLVEENFSPSLKIEWPDYVKAQHIIKEHQDGLPIEDIAKKYNWSKSKVKDTVRINTLIEDFVAFAVSDRDQDDESGGGLGLTENEAESVAAKNYQYFNEAQKSFYNALQTDFAFKSAFFKWINEGKFSSFPEVRVSYKAWQDPEARVILASPDPTAAKDAKAALDYNARVVRSGTEAAGRIDAFVKFLRSMKADEINNLPDQARTKLQEALELIEKMSAAAKK
jgi:hypothetical protein